MDTPFLSVVIPCFDEEDSLPELVRRVSETCAGTAGQTYEIVLVDDGSTDGTRELIRGHAKADPHIVGVFLSRNYGH